MTREQARRKLDEWAEMMQDRDSRVIGAADAGLTKLEISDRMRISHNTVYAILRRHREQARSTVDDILDRQREQK